MIKYSVSITINNLDLNIVTALTSFEFSEGRLFCTMHFLIDIICSDLNKAHKTYRRLIYRETFYDDIGRW